VGNNASYTITAQANAHTKVTVHTLTVNANIQQKNNTSKLNTMLYSIKKAERSSSNPLKNKYHENIYKK